MLSGYACDVSLQSTQKMPPTKAEKITSQITPKNEATGPRLYRRASRPRSASGKETVFRIAAITAAVPFVTGVSLPIIKTFEFMLGADFIGAKLGM